MSTLTIPKTFIKSAGNDDLVVLPRQEYERLLCVQKNFGAKPQKEVVINRSLSFKIPKRHEKFYKKVDRDLTEALRSARRGAISKTFETAEDAIAFLHRKRS